MSIQISKSEKSSPNPSLYGEFRRIINYDTCMGCYTCEEVCAFIHEGKTFIKLYDAGGGLRRPVSCFHCAQAPCIYACPTGAMMRDRDGAVKVDIVKCIGCASCLAACPFGIPEIVAPGYAIKCDLCEPLRKQGLDPACVSVCPAGAIVWGSTEKIAEALRTRALKKILYTKIL